LLLKTYYYVWLIRILDSYHTGLISVKYYMNLKPNV